MAAHSTFVQSVTSQIVAGEYGSVIAVLRTGDTVVYRLDFSGNVSPQTADFVIYNAEGTPVVDYRANSGQAARTSFGFVPVVETGATKYYPMKVVVGYLEAIEAYVADPANEANWLARTAVHCVAADLKYFKQGAPGKNNAFVLPPYPGQ